MKIAGKEISNKKIIGGVLLILFLSRCAQIKMESNKEDKELKQGGFSSSYEMNDIKELGFKDKREYEEFIKKSPIGNSDGEHAVSCAAVAEFWEKRDLSEKNQIKNLNPKLISEGLNDYVIRDYITKKITYKVVMDRKEYIISQYESNFSKDDQLPTIKNDYIQCHQKYGPYVLTKCGESGVCNKDNKTAADDENKSEPDNKILESKAKTTSSNENLIPVSKIIYDINKNVISAEENYNGKTMQLAGVFDGVEEAGIFESGKYRARIKEDWQSGFFEGIYMFFKGGEKETIMNLKKGDLISAQCEKFIKYGMSYGFDKCSNIKKIDTHNERKDIYLDKLIMNNNELINRK